MFIKRIVLLSLGIISLPVSAALSDSINTLNPGDEYRVIFVTTSVTSATSTDLGTYNLTVQSDAAVGTVTGGLGLSWNALASTETVNAQDNTGIFSSDNSLVSFFNTNGDLLATSGSDLWDGSLFTSVSYDQYGSLSDGGCEVSVNGCVWTGTFTDGSAAGYLGVGNSTIGNTSLSTSGWISTDIVPVHLEFGLYGASSLGTVPPSNVPLPAAAWLFMSAIAGLVGGRRMSRSKCSV